MLGNSFLLSADFFFKINFLKKPLGTLTKCQTIWIKIRTDRMSALIWVQTVCKDYQQMKKSPLAKKELKSVNKGGIIMLLIKLYAEYF